MPRTDVHQHLWSPQLLEALARRERGPRVRRADTAWTLQLPGEPDSTVPGDDVAARARLVHEDGLDRAVVALSTALGVELLAPAQAAPLMAAWEATADTLPPELAAWTAVSLAGDLEDEASALGARVERRAGLCLPAAALATPAAVERLAPVLGALERAGRPLFVHPGPAAAPHDAPAWWPALTDYVAQLQAAWLAFAVAGRSSHPRLRVVFAALAGLAPLHAERLAARGGPAAAALADDRLFYETSSYGPRAISAMTIAVGLRRLVHGSDRPVVAPLPDAGPGLGDLAWHALSRDNPARLLAPDPSPMP
jgi:predicted TIM-barrel fold metal-dependent hydrolase